MGVNLRPTAPAARAPAPDTRTAAETLVDQLGARVHIDVTIPRTSVRAKMRLCTRKEEAEAKAAARALMQEQGYPINGEARTAFAAGEEWAIELATQMIQRAVRDPQNVALELAPIEDWREHCDDGQILTLWAQYQDLVIRLDPLGAETLTDAQLRELTAAAKKKDLDLLMRFGSRLLALFAITSASPPATSPTPTSSPGE